MYARCSLVEVARKVFDDIPKGIVPAVCYNAMISGYGWNENVVEAAGMFRKMRQSGLTVSFVTILGLIPACSTIEHFTFGVSLHGLVLGLGFNGDSSIGNCLLSMYGKCGAVENARRLFDSMSVKGLITWNAMISGYAQHGYAGEVLELYEEIKLHGVCPDAVTLVGVLSSCAHVGAYKLGCEVDKRIEMGNFGDNPFLSNALINMHARCGKLTKARAVFDAMAEKTVISWTAIIGGYGIHGYGSIAAKLFDEMIAEGIRPDGTSFVSVLSACSHAGLTQKGLDYFDEMEKRYNLRPGTEHYSCVIDLLGRAGQLEKALSMIQSMQVKPDGAVWGALLGACRIHRNVELAELAFERVIELEPENVGYYVLLSSIYDDAKNTDGVLKVRKMMRERKLRKEPGCSYVQCKGRIHLFLAGDVSHKQKDEIYIKLDKLEKLVMEMDGREGSHPKRIGDGSLLVAGVHSEKLAVSFAILNTEPGEEIIVMKNLRVCEDCHLFMKLITRVVDRRFTVRDATRFHHFQDGICSCQDYW